MTMTVSKQTTNQGIGRPQKQATSAAPLLTARSRLSSVTEMRTSLSMRDPLFGTLSPEVRD